MKVAEALREAREGAGLTQRQLATLIGITPQFLSDIENDRRALGEKYLAMLPDDIRAKVAAAMVGEHQRAIERLNGEAP